MKPIFLPIEVLSRELPYKAPLAFYLAKLGHEVFIGRQQEIRLFWIFKDDFFYIDKSCALTKFKLFKDLKACGGGIGIFCEEGLVYRKRTVYIERVNNKVFELIDIFWCWGQRQYDDLKECLEEKNLRLLTRQDLQ